MDWILLLGGLASGLGIGTLLQTVASHFISRKSAVSDRLYQEKREAYLGLLDALQRAAVKHSNENAKNYAVWQHRCDLFGSPEVARHAEEMVLTNDKPQERAEAFRKLIEAMRDDLRR